MIDAKFRAWWKHPKYQSKGKMYMVGGISNVVDHDYQEPERDFNEKPQEICLVDELPTVAKTGWNSAKYITLMQYTGLKDKNGVEIYEGDIVTYKTGKYVTNKFKVKWDNRKAGWNLIRTSCDRGFIEVIGNIYSNPELLEAKA